MKKFVVSSVVIIAFIAYSLYQKAFGIQATPVITPSTISNRPSISPMATPSDTHIINQPTTQATTQSTTPTPTPQHTPTPTQKPNSPYKDGSYTGDAADALYGNIQVKATISNGRISDIQFLQYPNDRSRSIEINSQADPVLSQEAIQAQSAQVDIVSGASDSSQAFTQSLQSALDKAKS